MSICTVRRILKKFSSFRSWARCQWAPQWNEMGRVAFSWPLLVLSGISLMSKSHSLLKTIKFWGLICHNYRFLLTWLNHWNPAIFLTAFLTKLANGCLCWQKKSKGSHFHCKLPVSGFRNISREYFTSHIFCCVNKPWWLTHRSLRCVLKWPWAQRYQMDTS